MSSTAAGCRRFHRSRYPAAHVLVRRGVSPCCSSQHWMSAMAPAQLLRPLANGQGRSSRWQLGAWQDQLLI